MYRKLSILFLTLFIAGSVSGTTITSEKVNIDLESSTVNVEMEVGDLTSQRFTYFTNHEDLTLVESRINGEEVECTIERAQIESTISCPTDLEENFSVNMRYKTEGLADETEDQKIFSYRKSFVRPTNNFSIKATLPQGDVLVDGSNITTPVVSPSDGSIGSDGQKISVEWNIDPQLGDSQVYQVIYTNSGTGPGGGIALEKVMAGIIGIMLVSGAAVFIYRRTNRENLETVYGDLQDDEKELLDLMKSNGGEMLQKDAVEELDYSKAKVSGLVSELTEIGILKKEKEGRSNKLTISKRFKF